MSSEWLTAESFERNQRLLSAINTISINVKLAKENIAYAREVDDIADAKSELRSFLGRVEPLLRSVEVDRSAPILGTDQRMSLLVHQFASTRKQRPSSVLSTLPMEQVSNLLDSERSSDQNKLIEYLRALRQLVEQHTHADVVALLGEL
jgi:hypothetical protein